MKIVVIDNYDSFTFNLVQLVGKFTSDIIVLRNDKTTIEEIVKLNPDKIIISPGPGRPEDSNVSIKVIKELGGKIPLLGVCLGHQGIGYCFGATVTNAQSLMHGKTSDITHDSKTIYKDLPDSFTVGRYHSLVLDNTTIPSELEITSQTADGTIMGVRHKSLPIEGIQFHPESILTPLGENLIRNWLYQ